MVYNASERKHVRAAEKETKLREQQDREVVTQIMASVAGRQWFLSLLERGHVFATSFTGEALSSAFAEGERNIGIQLLGQVMEACPDQYILMMRERNERDATRNTRTERREPAEPASDVYHTDADANGDFDDTDRYDA